MKFLVTNLGLFLSCALFNTTTAASPTWSVNPGSFLYSMNVTTKLSVECNDLNDTLNLVGAFVNGECRGVANTSVLVNGTHLAFLTVYSNNFAGDTVYFEMYDAQLDSIYSITQVILFQDGAAIGHPTEPYSVNTNMPPTELNLSKVSVMETQADSLVGVLSTVDIDSKQHQYSLVAGAGDTDNTDFTITNDSLYAITTFDFDLKRQYSIRIETNDGHCTLQKVFNIVVKDSNHVPTGITLDAKTINENNSPLALVGTFATDDKDDVDIHSYNLISGPGDDDNSDFIIDGSDLKIRVSTDFEDQDSYSILVETDDGDSGVYQASITIEVVDINEAPELRDTTYAISENLGIGGIVGALALTDPDTNESYVFDIIEIVPFEVNATNLVTSAQLDYEETNEYVFNLEVTDKGGYTDVATIRVYVTNEIEPAQALPINEVLTPNNDGFNDFLVINEVQLYSDYSLRVYNRSGFVIYEVKENYDNSWNGTNNGSPLDSGVYYYLLQNNNDPDLYFNGTINLVR